MNATLDVALKEWEAVCRSLLSGRQTLLLRKGGIHETEGVFTLEHHRFLLFPTWLHQNVDWIKPADRAGAQTFTDEPASIDLNGWAKVTDILRVPSRAAMDELFDEHIYLPPLVDLRFSYRPDKPLYVLIVRAHRLQTVRTIQNTPAYAGCRSWVPLEEAVDISASVPASDDRTFAGRREFIRTVLGPR